LSEADGRQLTTRHEPIGFRNGDVELHGDSLGAQEGALNPCGHVLVLLFVTHRGTSTLSKVCGLRTNKGRPLAWRLHQIERRPIISDSEAPLARLESSPERI